MRDPAAAPGNLAPVSLLCKARGPEAKIGGRVIPIEFARMTPSMVGLLRINLRVPDDAPTGSDVPLELSFSAVAAQAFLGSAPTAALTTAIR